MDLRIYPTLQGLDTSDSSYYDYSYSPILVAPPDNLCTLLQLGTRAICNAPTIPSALSAICKAYKFLDSMGATPTCIPQDLYYSASFTRFTTHQDYYQAGIPTLGGYLDPSGLLIVTVTLAWALDDAFSRPHLPCILVWSGAFLELYRKVDVLQIQTLSLQVSGNVSQHVHTLCLNLPCSNIRTALEESCVLA